MLDFRRGNHTQVAMEAAPDITTKVSEERQNIMGTSTQPDAQNNLGIPSMPTASDMPQTGNPPNQQNNENSLPDYGTPDDMDMGMDDMGGMDDEMGMNDQGYGDGTEDLETSEPSPEDILKDNLKKNMIYFLRIIAADLELFQSVIINGANTNESNEPVINSQVVMNLLVKAKDALFNAVTKDFDKTSYGELLKRYIAIQRLFDIIIVYMEYMFPEEESSKIVRNPTPDQELLANVSG